MKIYNDFFIQNPWWESEKKINNDIKIKEFEQNKLKWYPQILDKFQFFSDRVYTIRGPRQVGKTTLLKLLIKKLIKEKNINPKSIFYYSFDMISNYKEILEIYKKYHNFSEQLKIKYKIIFWDEITFVKDWQKAIKYIIDLGLGKNTTLILTGSSSRDIRNGSERLPGRRGTGDELDKVLLPMTFKEFLNVVNEKLIEGEKYSLEDILTLSEKKLNFLYLNYDKVQKIFEDYLIIGGFPRAVEDYLRNGTISNDTKKIYLDIIVSDIEKIKKSRVILFQILKKIYETIGTRISFQTLAKETEIGSFHTVQEYIETLGDNYLLSQIYFWDISHKKIKPKKDKKIYFIDSLLFEVIRDIGGFEFEINPGIKIENLIFFDLLKLYEKNKSAGLSFLKNIFFWYSKKGNEIDFLINDKNIIPIEVKYQNLITPFDYLTMNKTFKRGILITKNKFFVDKKIVGIPASIFLKIIG